MIIEKMNDKDFLTMCMAIFILKHVMDMVIKNEEGEEFKDSQFKKIKEEINEMFMSWKDHERMGAFKQTQKLFERFVKIVESLEGKMYEKGELRFH